ncbi:hypothetical protein E4U52_007153 [Claviceps spartinae]|nr:hypothetical protein E4U52_007153 [Claviceps spartinae]
MATTPALSPEPPTYLCPKLSTKMQIVVPSTETSKGVRDRSFKATALRTSRGRPESEATLTLREEILKR